MPDYILPTAAEAAKYAEAALKRKRETPPPTAVMNTIQLRIKAACDDCRYFFDVYGIRDDGAVELVYIRADGPSLSPGVLAAVHRVLTEAGYVVDPNDRYVYTFYRADTARAVRKDLTDAQSKAMIDAFDASAARIRSAQESVNEAARELKALLYAHAEEMHNPPTKDKS